MVWRGVIGGCTLSCGVGGKSGAVLCDRVYEYYLLKRCKENVVCVGRVNTMVAGK